MLLEGAWGWEEKRNANSGGRTFLLASGARSEMFIQGWELQQLKGWELGRHSRTLVLEMLRTLGDGGAHESDNVSW